MQSIYHPGLGQSVNYSMVQVPEGGDGQTAAVVGLMNRYATEDATSQEIQADLRSALAQCPGCSPVEAVFWWVKGRVRFVRDEDTASPFPTVDGGVVVEALIRPRDMSVLCGGGGGGSGNSAGNTASCSRVGDCDDFSMYTAALLKAAGVPCAFVTVAADGGSNDYSHVYVAAYPNGVRIPLDTSHGARPGWETGNAHRVREWPVGAGGGMLGLVILIGLGAILLCR